jgi:hypothetical protein
MPVDHARATRLIAGIEQVRHRLTQAGLELFYRLLAEFDPPRAAKERSRLIAVLEQMRLRRRE